MTLQQYQEICEARDWCLKMEMNGFVAWYNLELAFHARRRALPQDVQLPSEDDDRER